ncbi:MAG: universal stress protein [Alphaproteobacteria bacterium]|nr:universal stress protein [Alphaproteobacteria bacterium]
MKTILVPMEHHEGMRSVLESTLLLARRFGSYIEGFPLRFGISEFVAVDPAGSIPLESYRQESLEEAAQSRRLFEDFMREQGVPHAAGTGAGLSFGWIDDAPEGEGFVGSYGRVFDITVLSRPDSNTIGLHNRAIESGLFESGKPILLAPPKAQKQIATNIMIHWNCSTEQARTTAFAMPLIEKAERVTVLTVIGGQAVPGPSSEQLLNQLLRNGIDAKPMSVGLEGRSTGEAILAAAQSQGCDLLVKGAYTQSRLRQMIFGGATSHILSNAELPVIMAH